MNGLSRFLKEMKLNAYIWLLAGGLFLGPLFLISDPSTSGNAGIFPFLLSPFLLPVFVPQLSGVKEENGMSVLIRSLLFPVFTGLIFLTTFLIFGTPRLIAGVKGILFLTSFSILLTGLTEGVQGAGGSSFVARWTSTVIGLLLAGSFVYLSPLVDHFYNRPEMRNVIITLATCLNPLLVMSGGILEQDLLRGAFFYEHLAIGRYYSYSAPSLIGVATVYTVTGTLAGVFGDLVQGEQPGSLMKRCS